MKITSLLPLVLAGTAFATVASAAPQTARNTAAVHAEQLAVQARQVRAASQTGEHTRGTAGLLGGVLGGGIGGENGPYANPYRAYPPSCMADPLPSTPSGPTVSRNIDLAAWVPSAGQYVREAVTVTFWRVPCSSSVSPHAITLMRIQRSDAYDGSTNEYPVFPGIRVAQGDTDFDDPAGNDFVRVALEPNTIISDVIGDSPVVYSTTYVLENYAIAGQPTFDFNDAFQVRLDNFFSVGTAQYVLNIPAYEPDADSYPTAFQPLPINGYMTSDYYTPEHSGEGIILQVFENPTANNYTLQLAWYTFGSDGQPLWLIGGAIVEPGTRVLEVPLQYRDNGGFAGDFGQMADHHDWGTVTLQFPNCNRMEFTFQSQDGLPSWVPQGSGQRTWGRLANVNGLICE